MTYASKRRSDTTSEPRDHYADVTAQIIAALEAGTPPWRRPWDREQAGGPTMPHNATTGARYRGINTLVLGMSPLAFMTCDPRWATYKQASRPGLAGAQAAHAARPASSTRRSRSVTARACERRRPQGHSSSALVHAVPCVADRRHPALCRTGRRGSTLARARSRGDDRAEQPRRDPGRRRPGLLLALDRPRADAADPRLPVARCIRERPAARAGSLERES